MPRNRSIEGDLVGAHEVPPRAPILVSSAGIDYLHGVLSRHEIAITIQVQGHLTMPKERPVVVLVFAILNIVFGSLGLVYSLCSGAAMGLVYGLLSSAGSALPGRSNLPIPP